MAALCSSRLSFFIIILASFGSTTVAATHRKLFQLSTNFILSSCQTTQYPKICYNSLQSYASLVQSSPRELAHVALSVSLGRAKLMSVALSRMKAANRGSMTRREINAMKDCVETVGDSIYLLEQSLREMEKMGTGYWGLQINDLQTWVSAALTDEDTCMEGFSGDAVDDAATLKLEIRPSIVRVAQLISNALDFINQLSQIGKRSLP